MCSEIEVKLSERFGVGTGRRLQGGWPTGCSLRDKKASTRTPDLLHSHSGSFWGDDRVSIGTLGGAFMSHPGDATQVLLEASQRIPGSFDRLFALLYDDLRLVALGRMQHENPGHTLQATALVHEAYVRLVDQSRCEWRDRAHFLAVASQAMRRALVDHARHRTREKRGGAWDRVPFEEALTIGSPHSEPALLALDDSMRRLQAAHPGKEKLVEMRFFGGLTHEECADVLSLSTKTVARHLDFAQTWLYRDMTSSQPPIEGESGP